MRIFLVIASLLAVAACTPQIPDSGAAPNIAAVDERGALADVMPEGAHIDPGSVEISNEQDFGAVSERESIESDAARIAANRDLYQIVEPTALPTRSGSSVPSIVEYALATTNSVGQSLYRRSSIFSGDRFARNCGKFTSADLAQEDFLSRGGPRRDPKGMDPDGDGFACYWTPEPYRQARAAADMRPAPVISTE